MVFYGFGAVFLLLFSAADGSGERARGAGRNRRVIRV